MKRLSVFNLLFLFSGGILAQTGSYIPYPENYVEHSMELIEYYPGYAVNYFHSEQHGDTIIGTFSYKKYYTGTGSALSLTGAVRNDIPNKKVYLYNFVSSTETLLFDFDLVIGDTVKITPGFGGDTTLVYDIDSILLMDGLYHNRYRLSNTNPNPCICATHTPSSLVEGLGYYDWNDYSIVPYGEFETHTFSRICAFAEGQALVDNSGPPGSGNCNSLWTNIPLIGNTGKLSVFPNPANDRLTIKATAGKHQIEMTDVLGRTMFRQIIEPEAEIDISELQPAIYFLRLTDEKGNSVLKKIIKNNP